MLKRNVIGCAAFWGHVLRVSYRQCKQALKAVFTHAVGTGKLGGFAHGDVVETR